MSKLEQYRSRPSSLYKYRSFDENFHSISILTENKIFFSSPKHFNDPFDCAIKVRYDLGNKHQVMQKLIDLEKLSNPQLAQSKIRHLAKQRWKEGDVFFKKSPDKVDDVIKEGVFNSTGVFSLSEDPKNLLMWSHYASSHNGFCLEFDSKKLGNYFTNYSFIYKKLIFLFKVDYSLNYPIVNPYMDSYEQRMEKSLLVKSVDWEYEKEWRLLFYNGSDTSFEIPEELITKVIVGIKISTPNLEATKTILRSKTTKIPLLQAKMKDSEFGIDFIDIDY